MRELFFCIVILLPVLLTATGVESSSQDSDKLLPSVVRKIISRELYAYTKSHGLSNKRDKEIINAKWAEISQKHIVSVQTEGLLDQEKKQLFELYIWAKMVDEAKSLLPQVATGQDFKSREMAKQVLDIEIERGTATLGELRAALAEHRNKYPHDKKDMLGLFSQIYKLAHITAQVGHPEFAINIIEDELNSLNLEHPHYSWRLAVESMPFYRAAGRVEEGLTKLKSYENQINQLVEKRNDNRPVNSPDLTDYDAITKRYLQLAVAMRNAYIRDDLIGKDAPGLTFTHFFNGDPLIFDELKGKVIVIDFWATWCAPCLSTFPQMREFYNKYKNKGVVVIGVTGFQGKMSNHGGRSVNNISHDQELALMNDFIRRHKITWPIAFSDRNCYDPAYGIDTIPRVAVIDKKGKLRLLIHSAQMDSIVAIVDKVLSEN